MRWILAVIIAALLLAGAASAHRMFVGQQITLDLFVFYDDGSPAANAEVKLYQEGALFAQTSPMQQGGLPSLFREKERETGAMRSREEDILRRDPLSSIIPSQKAGDGMKARLVLILLLFLLTLNTSCGHRMMMGYQVNEIR